jgi:hypothetical protein
MVERPDKMPFPVQSFQSSTQMQIFMLFCYISIHFGSSLFITLLRNANL